MTEQVIGPTREEGQKSWDKDRYQRVPPESLAASERLLAHAAGVDLAGRSGSSRVHSGSSAWESNDNSRKCDPFNFN